MNRTSSGRALVFRGWGSDADHVVKVLNDAGIPNECVRTPVPAIIGGHLLVCEVFVGAADLAAAERAVTPSLEHRKLS